MGGYRIVVHENEFLLKIYKKFNIKIIISGIKQYHLSAISPNAQKYGGGGVRV